MGDDIFRIVVIDTADDYVQLENLQWVRMDDLLTLDRLKNALEIATGDEK